MMVTWLLNEISWDLVIKESFRTALFLKRLFCHLKRVFGYAPMSAPMILQENARCAILPISSLLAMLDTIPVLKKLPLKTVFGYVQHMRSVKESLKRVFSYSLHKRSDKREFKESFSNMSAPMISQENVRCPILPILSLLAMLDMIPVLKKLPFRIGKLLLSMGAHTGNSL